MGHATGKRGTAGTTGATGTGKWAILATVVVMTFMVTLDGSIVNVALPSMSEELGVRMSDIEWVATSYLLLSCAGILICGRLGDIFGKVRVFQVGVALFTLGSLLCGLSHNLLMLVAARAVQGVGGAAAFANNQGILVETFPSNERGQALGWLSTMAALGSMAGPSLGGFLLSVGSWDLIFLVNVPVGIISLLVGLRTLPNRAPTHPGTLDRPGSVLLFSSMVLVVAAVTFMQQQVGVRELAMLGVGLVLLVAFVMVERRAADPVFPLKVLRNRMLVLNMLTLFAMFFVIGGQNLLLPFYLQDARGLTPLASAAFLTVVPVITGTCGPLAGYLSDRIGCYWPTSVGLGLVTVAEVALALLSLDTPFAFVVVPLVVYGLGDALFMAPNNSLVLGAAAPDELGFVGGLAGFSRIFGQTAGITFCTSALYARMSGELGYSVADFVPGQELVFTHSLSFVFVLIATVVGVGFAATVVRFVTVRKQEREANERMDGERDEGRREGQGR